MGSKRILNKENNIENSKVFKLELTFAEQFEELADEMNEKLNTLRWLYKYYVYNPTEYAREPYKNYTQTYCNNKKKIMFLGMNPGPWGMSQTGIPFGEVATVRDWIKIDGHIEKSKRECSIRTVDGFLCSRTEASGLRFWSLIKDLSVEPDTFFKHCFVYNYLPLQFINQTGKNIPPTALTKSDIFSICDNILQRVIKLYEVNLVVGNGKFSEQRAKIAINEDIDLSSVKVGSILHPSPRSKAANNWNRDVTKQLQQLKILKYIIGNKKHN